MRSPAESTRGLTRILARLKVPNSGVEDADAVAVLAGQIRIRMLVPWRAERGARNVELRVCSGRGRDPIGDL